MSGTPTVNTTVSGQRVPIATRREERKRFQIFGNGVLTHIVILVLAGLIWWIAVGMVSDTRTLDDAAALIINLDPALEREGAWALMPLSQKSVNLVATGPAKELTSFASEVASGRTGQAFQLTITKADIERLQPDNLNRVMFEVPLSRFNAQLKVPPEISVRAANKDQTIMIPLEQVRTLDAAVRLQENIVGEIAGYSHGVQVVEGFELEVRAPASRMREISRDEVRPVLKVTRLELDKLVENRAIAERKTREQVLSAPITYDWDLQPLDGVKILRKGTETEVTQVRVRFTFTSLRDFTPEDLRLELPAGVIFPQWMVEKGVRILNPPKSQIVLMKVLNRQKADVTPANVQLRLDLSSIKPEDVKMEPDPAAGQKLGKVFNLFLSLEINTEKLTYKLPSERVTAKQYLPVEEVQLAWTEQ